MKDYEHITKYENILNEEMRVMEETRKNLEWLKAHEKDYAELLDYYSSDLMREDLEDDEKGLIPKDLPRGVLSEDGVWNAMSDHYGLALEMLETALAMLETR